MFPMMEMKSILIIILLVLNVLAMNTMGVNGC